MGLPIILLLLRDINSQWLRIAVQNNATIQTNCLFQFLQCLEFNVAESFELISFLVLHQTNVLHRQLAEDLDNIALNHSLREITNKRQKRWLSWEGLLVALLIVVPAIEIRLVKYIKKKSA